MSDLGTEWKKISEEKDIKSLIRKDPNKSGVVTTNDVTVEASDRKEYLVTKDLNLRPTSFHFKYNEHWLKEDTNHFHSILRRYNVDIPIDNYDSPAMLTNALQSVKSKRRELKNTRSLVREKGRGKGKDKDIVEPDEDFTIESEDEIDPEFNAMSYKAEDSKAIYTKYSKPLETLPGKTIDQVLYDDFKAKYVKVISLNPLKIVWDDRRFCDNASLSTRTLDRLRRDSIKIEDLKKNDPTAYHNLFNRCYDHGRYELNGKYYCRTHFRDKKYGRSKDEDFHD